MLRQVSFNDSLAVVLAGGFGRRLKISHPKMPKQFLNLTNRSKSILQETIERIIFLGFKNILVIGNILHQDLLNKQIGHYVGVKFFLETVSCNTGVASCVGFKYAKENNFNDVYIFPSDHYIDNLNSFRDALRMAKKKKNFVIFGVTPFQINTQYGYILHKNGVFFIEKPHTDLAKQLIRQGALWNSGIVYSNVEFANEYLLKHNPEMYNTESCYQSLSGLSFDDAVLSKTTCIEMVVLKEVSWYDMGSDESRLIVRRLKTIRSQLL